jgi:opacity protein-like surface antigen
MFKTLFNISLLLTLTLLSLEARASLYLGGGPSWQNTEGYNGLLASAFLGYSLKVGETQRFHLAAEIFGDSGSLPLGQNYYRRTNYGFGASFLPGFVFRETILAYLRMGVETFRYSKTLQMFTGGQLGFGLQTNITKTWGLRGEYVYTGEGIIHDFGNCRFNFVKLALIYNFI